MDREEILEKSRRENLVRDEGAQDARNKGMQWGVAGFLFLCVAVLAYNLARGLDGSPARGLPAGLYRMRGLRALWRQAGEVHARHRDTGSRGCALRARAVCGEHSVSGARAVEDKLVLKNRLKVARAERGLSQGELARLVGVSRQTISSIETGQFNPTAKLALVLCIALDKKFEELFYF